MKMRYRASAGSLAFPIVIIVYSAYKFLRFSLNGMGPGSGLLFVWVYIAAIVLGGVLPIILTYSLKIETRDYFLPRLIIFLCTIAAVSVTEEFVVLPKGGRIVIMAISSAATLLYFYKIRPTRFSEWCVIFLSTPTVYMMIYYLLINTDVENLLGELNGAFV